MTPAPATPGIAAVILAAGSSRRFGAGNKLLAEVGGKPLLLRVIEAVEDAGLDPLVVVTGHEAEQVTATVAAPTRRMVYNAQHLDGIGTSIAAGVTALDEACVGVLIAQGDMPALDAVVVGTLVSAFVAGGCEHITCPRLADGRQGNPVIWPRRLFTELRALRGDRGAKRLIAAEGEQVIAVPMAGPAAAVDIDTPDELAAFIASVRSPSPAG